jgi:hypothetical protein
VFRECRLSDRVRETKRGARETGERGSVGVAEFWFIV